MFIDGFGVIGYRSFGDDVVKIGPLGKVNLFAGQNNSGKSNTLLFLKMDYPTMVEGTYSRGKTVNRGELDVPHGKTESGQSFGIGLTIGGNNYKRIIAKCERSFESLPNNYGPNDFKISLELVSRIITSPVLTGDGKMALFEYIAPTQTNSLYTLKRETVDALYAQRDITDHDIAATFATLYHADLENHSRTEYKERLALILQFIGPHHLPVPEVHLIPAIRQVGKAGDDYVDFGGGGIIRRLHQLQNPAYNKQHLRESFSKINSFLKTITGNSTAELSIPSDEAMIIVHMDGKTLPLSSLGTGIHEMVILAAAATVLEKQILCIEEPESHLHPLLQRKLIRYLQNETTNQYFLTTHSAHILDAPNVNIFHVQLEEGKTSISSAFTTSHRSAICADLGYRASDLVQANCVIWVEGPSDRIYLQNWIKQIDSELIEGVHYSIMFYGGKLLSHLKADDSEIDEFINLRRLNRHICILIDSDRRTAQSPLNATKKRIIAEFNAGPGFAWVTAGREIENYYDGDEFLKVVQRIHPSAKELVETGKYGLQSHFLSTDAKTDKAVTEINKVKVAKVVSAEAQMRPQYDWRIQVDKLVLFIRAANDD